jgi:hypothetical protein
VFTPAEGTEPGAIDSARLLGVLRDALVHRGLAVAEADGFQSYDLEIIVPPLARIPINALRGKDGSVSIRWRFKLARRRALVALAIALVVLLACDMPLRVAAIVLIFFAISTGATAMSRARRIPPIISGCARKIASQAGAKVSQA